ncbi:MAG: B12-binding domain-containing radical SAM protein [Ignavibacteriaceae bacterium]|nr:B12-binding domain-containing radical SAM protein [Ignavibacteriaceae bacterium]
MNILLVYPEMPDTISKFKDMVRLSGKKANFPPIGLLTVASILPRNWNKKLVDVNIDPLKEKDLRWADYVFISATNIQTESVKDIVQICANHKKKIVAGGPLFTHEYEKFPDITHFVLNEAEITLPQFISDLENNSLKRIYSSNEFADIKLTPPPMWDLIDLNKYLYSTLQYSRGCPYLCDFCDVTALFGRVPRTKSTGQILRELDLLVSNGKNEMIFFADDNLIGNKERLKKELLPALIEWRGKNNFAPAFATQLTINLVDDSELMQLMLEAGFRHILIGIESLQTPSLEQMRKKQNTNRNLLEDIKQLQSEGFIIIGTFIVGLDTDTEDVFPNLIDFIQESGLVLVVINVLKAPPGTELYKRMEREKRLLKAFEFHEDRTNIIPIMDKALLFNGYKKILENVYDPKNIYQRIIKYYSILNRKKVKYPIKRKIGFYELIIFLMIIFKLGIVNSQRKYFWQLIFWTLRNKAKYLDLSILFSLLMLQYQKLLKNFRENDNRGITIFSQ